MPEPYGFRDINEDGEGLPAPEPVLDDDMGRFRQRIHAMMLQRRQANAERNMPLDETKLCVKCKHFRRDKSLATPMLFALGAMLGIGLIFGHWVVSAIPMTVISVAIAGWLMGPGVKYAKCAFTASPPGRDPVTGRKIKPKMSYCSTQREFGDCHAAGRNFERR